MASGFLNKTHLSCSGERGRRPHCGCCNKLYSGADAPSPVLLRGGAAGEESAYAEQSMRELFGAEIRDPTNLGRVLIGEGFERRFDGSIPTHFKKADNIIVAPHGIVLFMPPTTFHCPLWRATAARAAAAERSDEAKRLLMKSSDPIAYINALSDTGRNYTDNEVLACTEVRDIDVHALVFPYATRTSDESVDRMKTYKDTTAGQQFDEVFVAFKMHISPVRVGAEVHPVFTLYNACFDQGMAKLVVGATQASSVYKEVFNGMYSTGPSEVGYLYAPPAYTCANYLPIEFKDWPDDPAELTESEEIEVKRRNAVMVQCAGSKWISRRDRPESSEDLEESESVATTANHIYTNTKIR